jgi:hypothetical protein
MNQFSLKDKIFATALVGAGAGFWYILMVISYARASHLAIDHEQQLGQLPQKPR